MAVEITIPRLGWSMDEGTFGEWLKQDGDYVQAGEPIFTLENEKAVQEIESVDSGILRILPNAPHEGDVVPVGKLVAWLTEEGEAVPDNVSAAAHADGSEKTEGTSQALATTVPSSDRRNPTGNGLQVAGETTAQRGGNRQTISPRAARLASELGIDWTTVTGSGKNGRIREQDIQAAASSSPGDTSDKRRHRVSSLRQTIAGRMLDSVQATAPVTLTTKIDATNLVSLRQQFKATHADVIPGYNDIIARLSASALRQHPIMNGQRRDGEIVEPDGIHIGLAVDTDDGLLVPVIRHCEKLSLIEVSSRSRDLIERARQRKCTASELTGGTFSITSLGAFGIDAFTPIINHPETAILGIGAIRREPVVVDDGQIVPCDCLTLSLTFDHRVVDGVPAARFLQTLSSYLENPASQLVI